jgi:hypothetical protein
MTNNHFTKAAVVCICITIAALISWEFYLRSEKQLTVSYDDGPSLWSNKRANVYGSQESRTVFIGSSRIKFDLDVPTWEKLTGENAIQLAIEGNSPLPILEDLANDPKFNGKLIIDVTEGLFFTNSPYNIEYPKKHVKYFKDETPAQKASFQLNHLIESQVAFLDKESFSLNALLDQTHVKSRPGVFVMPIFPFQFGRVTFERQNKMNDEFLRDTSLQKRVTDIWMFFAKMDTEKPMTGEPFEKIIASVKTNIDKIKARGGKIIFIRTPSSGPYWMGEQQSHPRKNYWDVLLAKTQTPGFHFQDNPRMASLICPEWSHLTPGDAIVFTEEFVGELQKLGWKFNRPNLAKL